MIEPRQSEVLVIGAGVAGLAAAVALSSAGVGVTLAERKPYVGGRAYSYLHPALDEVIDSQHVMLGCCTNLVDLCELCGAGDHVRWYDHITFLEPGGVRSVLGGGSLPAPGHAALGFLHAPMLRAADRAAIARGMLQFLRGYPADDSEPFSAWLQKTRQTVRAVRHFWEPVIVATLNDGFERCSTRYAGQVIYESLLKSAAGGRMGIPTQPLSEFYAAAAGLAERQGAEVRLRCSVERLEREGAYWAAVTSTGERILARRVVLALPFEQAQMLLATLPEEEPARADVLPLMEHFVHAPITTIHLWLDRAVTDLDHAALLDTRIQWMFNKTRIRRDEPQNAGEGQYLELVISASFAELKMGRDAILQAALQEVASFFPEVRKARLLRSGVLKEARATFSVTPGLEQYRPPAATRSEGLYLAGDWTRTGWPSTMEGGVRSGRLAAAAIAGRNFVTPDLPPAGLMRLLAR